MLRSHIGARLLQRYSTKVFCESAALALVAVVVVVDGAPEVVDVVDVPAVACCADGLPVVTNTGPAVMPESATVACHVHSLIAYSCSGCESELFSEESAGASHILASKSPADTSMLDSALDSARRFHCVRGVAGARCGCGTWYSAPTAAGSDWVAGPEASLVLVDKEEVALGAIFHGIWYFSPYNMR